MKKDKSKIMIGNKYAFKVGKGPFAVISGDTLMVKRFETSQLAKRYAKVTFNERQTNWKIVEIVFTNLT